MSPFSSYSQNLEWNLKKKNRIYDFEKKKTWLDMDPHVEEEEKE